MQNLLFSGVVATLWPIYVVVYFFVMFVWPMIAAPIHYFFGMFVWPMIAALIYGELIKYRI